VAVKAADVKKLREITGAGMLDCKNALTEADGDFRRAERILKDQGIAAAEKRSGRATNEGRIFSKVKDGKGGLIEFACETDFVARNTDFIEFGDEVITAIVDEDLREVSLEIESRVKELISTLKENITIRRFDTLFADEKEILVDYIHGEGKIGVVVKLKVEDADALHDDRVKGFAFDCALHVAAFNPMYLSKETVDEDYRKEQEEIFRTQAEKLGKPEKVLDGIVKGKLNKHFADICLLDQGFVKEDKKSVQQVMDEIGKQVGTSLSITDFLYYRVGEDISS
jgi:elongation factor Ts